MDKHVTILASFFIVLGILNLVGVLVVMTIFSLGSAVLFTVGAEDPDIPEAVKFLPAGFGLFISLLLALTAVPNLIAGYGLFQRRPWALTFSLIAGILNLPSVPFGTAVGVYAIWFFTEQRRETRAVHI